MLITTLIVCIVILISLIAWITWCLYSLPEDDEPIFPQPQEPPKYRIIPPPLPKKTTHK